MGRDGREDGIVCWSCAQPVGFRAMFCHACGTLQPVQYKGGNDYFARLGLPRRFDLDPALIERQHAGFHARLAAARFADRRSEERVYAALHRRVLDLAREAVADPWQRALHLLELAGRPVRDEIKLPPSRDVVIAYAALAEAGAVNDIQPVIDAAVERLKPLFTDLAAAFRDDHLDRARHVAEEISRWSVLFGEARLRQTELGAAQPASPPPRQT